MSEANGTDAKDIALHFCAKCNIHPTSTIIARTIVSVKQLLANGHTKKRIIDCINYSVDVKKLDLYSFGFIVKAIDNMYKEMDNHEELEKYREVMSSTKGSVPLSEVKQDNGDSAERNRNKLHRFGAQSRFGKEFDFDLLKE